MELKDELSVDGNSLTVEDLVQVARRKVRVNLSDKAISRIEQSSNTCQRPVDSDECE